MTNGEFPDRLADKIEKIKELEIEAVRRENVADEKREGLRIESVESIRLFRQASGYLARIDDPRGHFKEERLFETPHIGRILGHIDDYNSLLEELQNNPTFKSAVSQFEQVSYSRNPTAETARVTIGNQSATLRPKRDAVGNTSYPEIENFVIPRMVRQTEKLENSLVGRCMSGK